MQKKIGKISLWPIGIQAENKNPIQVFTNENADILHIHVNEPLNNCTLIICDLAKNILWNRSMEEAQTALHIDELGLEPGTYLARISNGPHYFVTFVIY